MEKLGPPGYSGSLSVVFPHFSTRCEAAGVIFFMPLTWHRQLFGDFITILPANLQFEVQKKTMATVQFE